MSASTDLAIVETLNPAVVFAPGGVDSILEKIRTEVKSVKTDISTGSGRDQIRSLAFKVARSKTALDELGKNLVADLKKQTGAIDAERRRIRDDLDALKDEVRQPLTDWEDADKRRIEAHEAAIAEIESATAGWSSRPSADDIAQRVVWLSELPKRDWQEFASRAAESLSVMLKTLRERHAEAVTYEAEQAELARLRQAEADRAQRERDERIAAEAAERARTEAETKAKREADQAAERAATEQRRLDQERAAAEARAIKAEEDRIAAERRAAADATAAAEAAERRRLKAIEDERARVAGIQAQEAAETARREADKKHKAKINGAALAALLNLGIDGLSESAGKAIIVAIAQGAIPHTKISY